MRHWVTRARQCVERGERCGLIRVTHTRGSTPREVGATMLLTPGSQYGSIGGGKLELDACTRAGELLAQEAGELALSEVYQLGPRLGQCCGGTVEVWVQSLGPGCLPYLCERERLENAGTPHMSVSILDCPAHGRAGPVHRMLVRAEGASAAREHNPGDALAVTEALRALREGEARPRWTALPGGARALIEPPPDAGPYLVLFGAGHVGRALVQVLAPLQWPLLWVETRDDAVPPEVPDHVTAEVTDAPEACVDAAPPGSAFLIMTHDHALDFRLCEHALQRSDAIYCGLIGSRSKRTRFVRRLRERGAGPESLARLTCPIGFAGLGGKAPGEIAIAVAAQLLRVHAGTGALAESLSPAAAHTGSATS